MFNFMKIDRIVGNEIDLVFKEAREAVPEKEYMPCYIFDICLHGTETKAGSIGFRVGHNRNTHYGGNIGYGVFEEFRGNHYAAKACMMLRGLALHHNQNHLIITCDPDNIASRKTCEYIGADLLEIIDLPDWTEMYKMGKKVKCRYRWKLQEENVMDIKIKKLTPEITEEYIEFFDNRAFSDNPEWSACYCTFFHFNDEYKKSAMQPGVDIHDHNRNLARELIRRGILKGYLAYVDGVVMGWCNANDKSAYETLNKENRPELWEDDDKPLKCVTCFTIAPSMRRKGLSTALLKRVCEDAANDGYEIVEAYPRKSFPEINKNYHGPYPLYEKAGFEVYKELEKETIVRKYLR